MRQLDTLPRDGPPNDRSNINGSDRGVARGEVDRWRSTAARPVDWVRVRSGLSRCLATWRMPFRVRRTSLIRSSSFRRNVARHAVRAAGRHTSFNDGRIDITTKATARTQGQRQGKESDGGGETVLHGDDILREQAPSSKGTSAAVMARRSGIARSIAKPSDSAAKRLSGRRRTTPSPPAAGRVRPRASVLRSPDGSPA